jgi:predicted DNA-binding transcriptional regulator YafY
VAIRAALRARQKLRLTDRAGMDRTLRPLRLDYWARLWTLTGWCETRGDFDTIPLERIAALAVLPALFVDEAGKTLHDLPERGAPARPLQEKDTRPCPLPGSTM